MKICSSLFIISCVQGKATGEKGRLSVSHRNMFQSDLPVIVPTENEHMPDFIINGVNKCGTTAASFFLGKHTGLQRANLETNFFNTDDMYSKGFEWYVEQFPEPIEGKKMYEKTPAYYKSHVAPLRIKAAKEDIQLVTVVCDNVHRTLSRYLHIQKHAQQKLPTLGFTLDEFNDKLRTAVPEFNRFLADVKANEGGDTMSGLMQALNYRMKNAMRPFNLLVGDQFDMILADGFYAVHHAQWTDHFNDTQILVVNGNNFLNTPWIPMKKIQNFLNIETQITRDSFVVPIDDDGNAGIPCLVENGEADCIGKGDSQKGRSLNKGFSQDVTEMLHELFKPFDTYFAHQVLKRQTFEWNFGLE